MSAAPKILEPTGNRLGVTVYPCARGTILSVSMVDSKNSEMEAFSESAYHVFASQTRPFSVIVDLRGLHEYPANQREMYANVRQRMRILWDQYHRLTVYIATSDKQRGFVTAVGWKAAASAASGRTFVEQWYDAYELCQRSLE